MGKSSIDRLLDEVETVIKRRKMSVRDFAREIGYKTKGGYVIVHRFLRGRQFLPKGENILKIQNWLNKQHGKTT